MLATGVRNSCAASAMKSVLISSARSSAPTRLLLVGEEARAVERHARQRAERLEQTSLLAPKERRVRSAPDLQRPDGDIDAEHVLVVGWVVGIAHDQVTVLGLERDRVGADDPRHRRQDALDDLLLGRRGHQASQSRTAAPAARAGARPLGAPAGVPGRAGT
jgi:hypothetical protein